MAATAITARTLEHLIAAAETQDGVKFSDLQSGDWIVVRTKNSTYTLATLGDGTFMASGGWFAAERAEDRPVQIRGCTWGGSALLVRMVAAPGMCIEFANGVRTTRAREVRLIRAASARLH